jgi:hypothetical protein
VHPHEDNPRAEAVLAWLIALAFLWPAIDGFLPAQARLIAGKVFLVVPLLTVSVLFRAHLVAVVRANAMSAVFMALWIGFACLSVAWSTDERASTTGVVRLLGSGAVFVLAQLALRRGSMRDIVTRAITGFSSILALGAILQFGLALAGHPLGFRKVDGVPMIHLGLFGTPRATAGFLEPNGFGHFLFFCMTWLALYPRHERGGKQGTIVRAVTMAAIVVTGCKTAILGGGVVCLLSYLRHKTKRIEGTTNAYAAGLIFAAAVMIPPCLILLSPHVKNIRPYPLKSSWHRILLWDSVARCVGDAPVIGSGIGRGDATAAEARTCAVPFITGETAPRPHNLFLQAVVETGGVGATLMAAFLVFTLVSARGPTRDRMLIAAAWLLAASFHNVLFDRAFWLSWSALGVVMSPHSDPRDPGSPVASARGKWSPAAVAAIVLAWCALVGLAVKGLDNAPARGASHLQSCGVLSFEGENFAREGGLVPFHSAVLGSDGSAGGYFRPWPLAESQGMVFPTFQMVVYADLPYARVDLRAADERQGRNAAAMLEEVTRSINKELAPGSEGAVSLSMSAFRPRDEPGLRLAWLILASIALGAISLSVLARR